jgi:hypothetical protein
LTVRGLRLAGYVLQRPLKTHPGLKLAVLYRNAYSEMKREALYSKLL